MGCVGRKQQEKGEQGQAERVGLDSTSTKITGFWEQREGQRRNEERDGKRKEKDSQGNKTQRGRSERIFRIGRSKMEELSAEI